MFLRIAYILLPFCYRKGIASIRDGILKIAEYGK